MKDNLEKSTLAPEAWEWLQVQGGTLDKHVYCQLIGAMLYIECLARTDPQAFLTVGMLVHCILQDPEGIQSALEEVKHATLQ